MRRALPGLLVLAACSSPRAPAERNWDPDYGATKPTQVGRYRVGLTLEPAPPPLGELFRTRAAVTLEDGTPVETGVVKLDARMPQHDHGMETRPRVREGVCEVKDTDSSDRRCRHPGGVYVADGFKFHMSGDWTVTVEIDGPAGPDSTDFVVTMP